MLNFSSSRKLTPLLSEHAADLLQSQTELFDWVHGFGSPLHIVMPDQAKTNLKHWQTVLQSTYENCQVHFALKACKSKSLLRTFAMAGAGADVSSVQEMTSAFSNLVRTHDMALTGPAKPDHEIEMALGHEIALHIDCIEELERILSLVKIVGRVGPIFLRCRPEGEPNSRFGMTGDQIKLGFRLLKQAGITQVGISFHLNNYKVSSRVEQLCFTLELARYAFDEGLHCSGIDIGGGFPMRYLDGFDPEVFQNGEHWGDESKEGNYPYAEDTGGPYHAADAIETALKVSDNRAFLMLHQVPISLQPGRSLLDQCGLTVFEVIDVKDMGDKRRIVVLDGMSFSLSETWFDADFVPEPLIIQRDHSARPSDGAHYFLAGRSCLERDIIRWRGLTPEGGIKRGDLTVFANTAGYQMDSNESTFHQIPIPRKISVTRRKSTWIPQLDE